MHYLSAMLLFEGDHADGGLWQPRLLAQGALVRAFTRTAWSLIASCGAVCPRCGRSAAEHMPFHAHLNKLVGGMRLAAHVDERHMIGDRFTSFVVLLRSEVSHGGLLRVATVRAPTGCDEEPPRFKRPAQVQAMHLQPGEFAWLRGTEYFHDVSAVCAGVRETLAFGLACPDAAVGGRWME
jgi:hypothetical protein